MFNRNLYDFYLDLISPAQDNERMAYIIQNLLDELMGDADELETTSEAKKIPGILMQCLDVLYDFMNNDDPITLDVRTPSICCNIIINGIIFSEL